MQPVYAVTGENNNDYDLTVDLIQSGIAAFIYFLVAPVSETTKLHFNQCCMNFVRGVFRVFHRLVNGEG